MPLRSHASRPSKLSHSDCVRALPILNHTPATAWLPSNVKVCTIRSGRTWWKQPRNRYRGLLITGPTSGLGRIRSLVISLFTNNVLLLVYGNTGWRYLVTTARDLGAALKHFRPQPG